MYRLKFKKKSFTLAETIIVCSIFALMVIGIIFGINRAFIFMNNTRLQVRATNFTREGVEMVYNLRDTNRRKNYGDKDNHRIDIGNNGNDKLSEGFYAINEEMSSKGDTHIVLSKLNGLGEEEYESVDGFFGGNEKIRVVSKITFTGTYSYYSGGDSGGQIATGKLEDLLGGSGIEFYRVLRVHGIYCKTSENPNDTASCTNDSDPKELRFCVKVFYTYNGGHHASELCSIMTNFME